MPQPSPKPCILSFRAPGGAFVRQLRAAAGDEPDVLEVYPMRHLPLRGMLAAIAGLRGRDVIVAVEGEDVRPLAGHLILLATMGRSRSVRVMWPDGRTEPVGLPRAAGFLGRILSSQVGGRLAHKRAAREIRRLAAADPPRTPLKLGEGRRVLYLDANLSFGLAAGGSLGHTRGVIDGLIRGGFEVDYASVKPRPSGRPEGSWIPIEPPELYAYPQELNYYLFSEAYERRAAAALAALPHAFLYQRMSLHNISGLRLRERANIPVVLEYNGSEAWAFANWDKPLQMHDMALLAERAALRQSDLVVTVSDVLGDGVAEAGVPRERIVVYPNCIDPAIFDPGRFSAADNEALRTRLGIPADARLATFIGTFGRWHGVDFLAHAIRGLIDRDPGWVAEQRLHFLLVGDGLKMPEVRAAIGEPPYSASVTLAGLVPQAEAPAFLAASDIFLSPHLPNSDGSAFFGSPTKLFEYMAMGRPIIASDLDQIGAVLRGSGAAAGDGPLAALFRPGDEAEFLAALRAVVDAPDAGAAMAARARAAALASYTWDHHVGAILDRMEALGMLPPERRRDLRSRAGGDA